ncbi:hypothetical protein A2W24_02450 [Microgenomates group bacterium RBG_16_45_19]|nr:MAG: hypothetical protein A2W24_02450 [Microgenomates group bacterium RBG_16_45_19]
MTKVAKPQVVNLDSGMRVMTVPMAGINSVTVLAMVGVGSRFETAEQAGISHFLEHLPFKGTKHYPTPMAVAEAIDSVGGKHNAFTSKEYTGYWVKVAAERRELALDVVSDLLLTPKLDPDDIERERGVIIEEINMYEDEPQVKVANLFDELVYAGSPLAMDTAGYKQTVKGLNLVDFKRHYQTWYHPANVVVGVVGNITTQNAKLKTEVENYFKKGEMRAGGGVKAVGLSKQTQPRLTVYYKKTEQAHFYLGYPAIGWTDQRRYALAVLTTILGGNSSSRLFNEIREKRGLAYYAYASNDLYQETGALYALEGVAIGKIGEALTVTLAELAKVKVAGQLTEAELKRAQEYLVGKMSLDLEDSANMANMMVRKWLLEDEVTTVVEVMAKIRGVSLDQVVALAREIIRPERLNLAIVGPFKDEQPFLTYLK